jgi:hypothetical protein
MMKNAFFNLILARRGMYVEMGMNFVGMEEWERKQGMVTEHENGLCGEGGIGNDSLPLTTLISSRDFSLYMMKNAFK